MPHPHDHWTILPHGPLEQLADNLYTVTGKLHMPMGESTRHMTVVKLRDDRLVIYSAIALNEPELTKLLAIGKPAYLVVPSDIHRIDIKAWKERFPELVVIAPRGSRDKISELVAVDTSDTELNDPRVQLLVVPGTADQEFAMLVDTGSGKTLVVNDLIFNLPKLPGFFGVMMRLLGFGPGVPTMPKLVMMKLVRDKHAVRSQLQAWAQLAGLERVVVSHGAPIDHPSATLQRLAEQLA